MMRRKSNIPQLTVECALVSQQVLYAKHHLPVLPGSWSTLSGAVASEISQVVAG
jgi:hypothetical protein